MALPPPRFPAGPPPGPPPPGYIAPPVPQIAAPAARPSEPGAGWTAWQIALLGIVGMLIGLCLGVVIGSRLSGTSETGERVLESPSISLDPGDNPGIDPAPITGSATDPVPVGQGFLIGDGWTVRLLEVDTDAGDIVVAESELNEPPGANETYVLLSLQLEYDGPTAGEPQDVLLSLLDAEGNRYFGFEYSCGRIPNPLTDYGEVPAGSSITGNACFAVPADRVADMRLVVQVLTGPAVHYALR